MAANDREYEETVHRTTARQSPPAPLTRTRQHGRDPQLYSPSAARIAPAPSNPPIPREIVRELADHAAACAPAEACGLILPKGVRRCCNALPPRKAPTGYLFAPDDAIFLAENAATGRILAIYHAHPAGPARWSAEDDRGAWFAGAPLYPGIPRIIVGCHNGVPFEIACYECTRHSPGATQRVGNHATWRQTWRIPIAGAMLTPPSSQENRATAASTER